MSILYFAHSYRDRDARVVDYFGRLMRSEGLVPSIDPPSDSVNAAKLQRHLNSSDGMVAVLSKREDGTSPHILFELSLAIRSGFPLLVFAEDTLPNDIISRLVPQSRFSFRSYLRQTASHRQALRFLKAYIASTPSGGYRPVGMRRTCLVLGSGGASTPLLEATAHWIASEGDYEIASLVDPGSGWPWQPFDAIRSAALVVSYASSHSAGAYLAGVASGAGVPTIELTADADYRYNPRVPAEYQSRYVEDVDSLTEVLGTEFDLFEQDFLELSDQEEVDRYASFLVDLRGEYDAETREAAIREVIIGDKYEVHGQAGAVGREASAENITFEQLWQQNASHIDLARLADELETLRRELKGQASTRKDDAAVAEIGAAAEAAERGDGPEALSRLQRAGQWALAAAMGIGTSVAAQALKAALGK